MEPVGEAETNSTNHLSRIKLAAAVFTVLGLALFTYFIYSVGFDEIYDGIARVGFVGFAILQLLYLTRIVARSYAWNLSVHAPYSLSLKDTVPAVIIGEAMSSTIPLGILISGTTKAVVVRKRIPLVAAFSSVATENLFYSLVTGLFLIAGAVVLLRSFSVEEGLVLMIDGLIGVIVLLIVLGILMVLRQWHFASETCEKLYQRGYFKRLLFRGREHVRLFENLVYDFYRAYPQRFLPIFLLEAAYHVMGVAEVWYILYKLTGGVPHLMHPFLLELVSRLITVLFKLVPFMIGVDEAGAQLVGRSIALAAGVGVTLAIIRKGRILFWTALGWLLILKRGLSIKEISDNADLAAPDHAA